MHSVHAERDQRPWYDRPGSLALVSVPALTAGAAICIAAPAAGPVIAAGAVAAMAALAWHKGGRHYRRLLASVLPEGSPLRERLLEPDMGKDGYGGKRGEPLLLLGRKQDGEEYWMTYEEARQHMMVLGNTGSGKTEGLVSLLDNAVAWGSGAIFIDGKGDVSLRARVRELLRSAGREDDLLVLDFTTGRDAAENFRDTRGSHTFNPFASGTSQHLNQMMLGLLDERDGHTEGATWVAKRQSLLSCVLRTLVWLRDARGAGLDARTLLEHLDIRRIMLLADESETPDLPDDVRASLRSYLSSLQGYHPEKGSRQAQSTLDEHGSLKLHIAKILATFADTFGHIFANGSGDVDMRDVVSNRRILLVLLPPLERVGDDGAILGKIVVSSLKANMGRGLQVETVGWNTSVTQTPGARTPFLVILDDVQHYAIDGMALMAAQGRALGYAMVYSAPDIPTMMRFDAHGTQSIIANTSTKIFLKGEPENRTGITPSINTKIFMRIEEPDDADESSSEIDGKGRSGGTSGRSYSDTLEARFEAIDRIDRIDLSGYCAGQATVFKGDSVDQIELIYTQRDRGYQREIIHFNRLVPHAVVGKPQE